MAADLYPHNHYGDMGLNFRRTALTSVEPLPPHSPAKTMTKTEETRYLPDSYTTEDMYHNNRSQYDGHQYPLRESTSLNYHDYGQKDYPSAYQISNNPAEPQRNKVTFADQVPANPRFQANPRSQDYPHPQPHPQGHHSQASHSQATVDPMQAYAISQLNRYATPKMDYGSLHPTVLKLPNVSADYLHSEYQEKFVNGENSDTHMHRNKSLAELGDVGARIPSASVRLMSGHNIAHNEYEMNRSHTRKRVDEKVRIFERVEDVPNQFRNDYRYHIVQATDGKYHVYDMNRWNTRILYDDGRAKNIMPSTIDSFMKEFQSLDKLNDEYSLYVKGQRRQPSAHSISKRDSLGNY